jgi:hypothetical protein
VTKIYDDQYYAHRRITMGTARKKYGFFSFVFDCILTLVTGGLWLIWVFVREMRKR